MRCLKLETILSNIVPFLPCLQKQKGRSAIHLGGDVCEARCKFGRACTEGSCASLEPWINGRRSLREASSWWTQASNAIAIRYLPPIVKHTYNQTLPTSGTATDSTPGDIVITGNHFGAPNSATSGRYGDPLVMVGTRKCIVRTWSDDKIQCALPAGEGADLIVKVTTGEQTCDDNNHGSYTYAKPTIDGFNPQFSNTRWLIPSENNCICVIIC